MKNRGPKVLILAPKNSSRLCIYMHTAVLTISGDPQSVLFLGAESTAVPLSGYTGSSVVFVAAHDGICKPLVVLSPRYQWWGTNFSCKFWGQKVGSQTQKGHKNEVFSRCNKVLTEPRVPNPKVGARTLRRGPMSVQCVYSAVFGTGHQLAELVPVQNCLLWDLIPPRNQPFDPRIRLKSWCPAAEALEKLSSMYFGDHIVLCTSLLCASTVYEHASTGISV